MKKTCDRCGKTLTFERFSVTVEPMQMMGYVQRYTMCRACADSINKINLCEKSQRLEKEIEELKRKNEALVITAKQNQRIAEMWMDAALKVDK